MQYVLSSPVWLPWQISKLLYLLFLLLAFVQETSEANGKYECETDIKNVNLALLFQVWVLQKRSLLSHFFILRKEISKIRENFH